MKVRYTPFLVAVCVLFIFKALLWASVVIHDPGVFIMGDGNEYKMRADTLHETGEFGVRMADGSVWDSGYRLPFYPFFLAMFKVSDGAKSVAIWSALQLVIFHVWLAFAGRWMWRRYGDKSATYFVIALSVTLPWLHYVSVIHADFLFAVLLFSGVLFLLTASEGPPGHRVYTLASALCMGSAALTRPDLIFFPFWVLFSWAGLLVLRRVPVSKTVGFPVAPSLVVGFATFCFMAVWAVRNYYVVGRFSYTTVIDTVIRFFASRLDDVEGTAHSDLGILEMLSLMGQNAGNILSGFVPALVEVFFNPSRWYLHFYMKGWGADLSTSGVPMSKIGFAALPPVEQVYIVVGVLIPVMVFVVFAVGLWVMWKNRRDFFSGGVILALWIMTYLLLQKGIWGALTEGSGQRYGMSILPFVVMCGSLAFASTFVRGTKKDL